VPLRQQSPAICSEGRQKGCGVPTPPINGLPKTEYPTSGEVFIEMPEGLTRKTELHLFVPRVPTSGDIKERVNNEGLGESWAPDAP